MKEWSRGTGLCAAPGTVTGLRERSSVQTELGLRLSAIRPDIEPSDHNPGWERQGTLREVCDWVGGRSFKPENEFD